MRLVEALTAALRERGARCIFGIPGDFALPLFDGLVAEGRLPVHTLAHEPSVGFAADAAARYTSGLGVAAVTYGAGGFNIVNATAGAYAEKSPLVVISGAPGEAECASGLLVHHQGPRLDSQMRVFAEITAACARLDDPRTAAAEIGRVLDAALHDARPVYLEIPRDRVAMRIGRVPPPAPLGVDEEAVADCAEEIMDRLTRARRPVLMVGVEVRRYGLEARVAELARRLRIPVVTSFMGRGLMTGTEVQPVGTYLGLAGDPRISRLVEESDALLLLGVILSDTNFAVSAGRLDLRRVVHAFDRRVRVAHHIYPEVPLMALVEGLLERARPLEGVGMAPLPVDWPRGLVADEEPVTPVDIARAINDAFARHGPMPMTADVGDCLFTAMDIAHTELAAPGYYAGMGFGVPAGIGVQLATGRRTLVLVGDGAFQMTGMELAGCGRLGIDPVVVLFDNAGWEMLRVFDPEAPFNDLGSMDWAALARALGGDGYTIRCRRELREALDAALTTRGRFQLLHVQLKPGAISPTLARFVEAQKRARQRRPERRAA